MSSKLMMLFGGVSLVACARGPGESTGPALVIDVAPLTLPDLGRACYDLAVATASGPVWSAGDPALSAPADTEALCSDVFGNDGGGDISYIGPCDASEPAHFVTLWIDALFDEGGAPLTDWHNPCPAPAGCTLPATCDENADTPVVFNLVVMRDAGQGFFDIAVNFEDIFCSAKLDCSYDDAGLEPIELLFRDGERAQTAVATLACTAGPGVDEDTVLHMSEVRIECGTPATPTFIFMEQDNYTCVGDDVFGTAAGLKQSGVRDFVPTVTHRSAPGVFSVRRLDTHKYYQGGATTRLPDRNGSEFVAGGLGVAADGSDSNTRALAIWKKSASQWNLHRVLHYYELTGNGSFPSAADLFYDGEGLRLWLDTGADLWGDYFELAPNASGWSVAGPYSFRPVGVDFCLVDSIIGDEATGKCFVGGTTIPVYATLGSAPTSTVLDGPDPALGFGAVTTAFMPHPDRVIGVYEFGAFEWTRSGGGPWVGSPLVPTPGAGYVFGFFGQDYGFWRNSSASNGTLYRFSPSGIETWTTATLNGAPPAGWRLFGYEARLGIAFGAVRVPPQNTFWPAVATPVSGQPLAFHVLPAPDTGASMRVFGVLDYGPAVRLGGGRANELVWELDPAGSPFVPTRWFTLALDLPEVFTTNHLYLRTGELSDPAHVAGRATCDMVLNFNEPGALWAPDAATGSTAGSPPGSVLPPEVFPILPASEFPAHVYTRLDPTISGNAWDDDPDPGDPVWQYAVFRGDESLLCDGEPCNKHYWNVAIGFDSTQADCKLQLAATAAPGAGLIDGETPTDTTWPYLTYEVALTGPSGGVECRRNPLNGPGSGVETRYTDVGGGARFCHRFDGAATSYPECVDYADYGGP